MLQEVQVAVLQTQERSLNGQFDHRGDFAKALSSLSSIGLLSHALFGSEAQAFDLLRPGHLHG